MRIVSIVIAVLVAATLYLMVFERPAVIAFAEGDGSSDNQVVGSDEPATVERRVSVVALNSTATQIDSAVLLRGRTEAARQVAVSSETDGKIMSRPLRKGAFVTEGQLLCELDPGTRVAQLAEARARLVEAEARGPEAEARIAEAEARLQEAMINDNAANKLSQDGFASQTRVAQTMATAQSARASVQAAKSGLESASAGVEAAGAAVAAAEREIEKLKITAPFAGLLETDTAELGTLMQAGSLCATIIQLDPIKLVGFVPETEVSKVEVGALAGARLASGQEIQGQVTFLSRSSDPSTRTFRTEVEVANEDLSIRDGQTVEIMIQSDGRKAHLLPQSALTLNDNGDLGLRIIAEGDVAQFAEVSVLRDTVEGVWLAGLDEKVAVIVVGQEYVSDGVKVDPTFRQDQNPGGAGDTE